MSTSLTSKQYELLTEALTEAHDMGYSLDDPDFARWLGSVVATLIADARLDAAEKALERVAALVRDAEYRGGNSDFTISLSGDPSGASSDILAWLSERSRHEGTRP